MPNGTYGGVRGRKTKVGGKLLLRFPPTRFEYLNNNRRFCHSWLNIFRFKLQIYHNSFTFASGFGQNLSEISEKHEGSYVYPSEH
jgi:hypothetical protein